MASQADIQKMENQSTTNTVAMKREQTCKSVRQSGLVHHGDDAVVVLAPLGAKISSNISAALHTAMSHTGRFKISCCATTVNDVLKLAWTARRSTAQHGAAWHSTAQHGAAQHKTY